MRHRVAGRKFSRNSKERKALFLGLAVSLIENGQMVTTLAKAKTAKSLTEKLVTTAKKGDLPARRKLHSVLRKTDLVNKLVDELAPLFKDRAGGYLRLIRLPERRGDNAPMAKVEFVVKPEKVLAEEAKKPKKEKEMKIGEAKVEEAKANLASNDDRQKNQNLGKQAK